MLLTGADYNQLPSGLENPGNVVGEQACEQHKDPLLTVIKQRQAGATGHQPGQHLVPFGRRVHGKLGNIHAHAIGAAKPAGELAGIPAFAAADIQPGQVLVVQVIQQGIGQRLITPQLQKRGACLHHGFVVAGRPGAAVLGQQQVGITPFGAIKTMTVVALPAVAGKKQGEVATGTFESGHKQRWSIR